ncbi:MAG: IS1 family transposase [Blastocatellia bacterium]
MSYFHTDGWPSYRRVLPQTRHSVSKGGTLHIERHNLNFSYRVRTVRQARRSAPESCACASNRRSL